MNKATTIGLTVLVGTLLAACDDDRPNPGTERPVDNQTAQTQNTNVENQDSNMGIEVTLEEAFETFSETYADVALTGVSLKNDNRGPYYTLHGVDKDNEYQVAIDATNGNVINEWQDEFKNSKAQRWATRRNPIDLADVIEIDQAIQIARDETGEELIHEVELKEDDRKLIYDIEYQEMNDRDVEVELDATNGKVLDIDY